MTEQLALLTPTGPVPVRSHPTPKTMPATQRAHVRAGRHPMGHPMPERGDPATAKTCGSCAHRQTRTGYPKCGLTKATRGAATDIRLRWAACVHWLGEVSP